MHKVTVEGCLNYVPNRFELVLLLSHRAHELCSGASPLVNVKGDKKKTAISICEMSEGKLDPSELRRLVVEKCYKQILSSSSLTHTRPGVSPMSIFSDLDVREEAEPVIGDIQMVDEKAVVAALADDLDDDSDEIQSILPEDDEEGFGDSFSFDGDDIDVED